QDKRGRFVQYHRRIDIPVRAGEINGVAIRGAQALFAGEAEHLQFGIAAPDFKPVTGMTRQHGFTRLKLTGTQHFSIHQ
ncbi:hypothetical protein, partial [Photorhabdus sp. CRCIA-P01]|uniref:hypothetical protein n=1 Tax=Photorhabdus sp. CRCIA-P01 TaxID=2019570 RepID=UPI00130083C0